jgi:hypothetical protein
MGDPAVAAQLAKRFEPILFFHRQESFFPIDPKWYLEQCALWRAGAAFDEKKNWGEPPRTLFPRLPQIAKNQIAALASETGGARAWLGAAGADFGVGPIPTTEWMPPNQEHFLEFVGWEPAVAPPNEVTATSNNRHAALNPKEYVDPLKNSRQWYYVEYLDNQDLIQYTANPNVSANGLDLFTSIANNKDLSAPVALLFHFLYPLHQETLEGCENAGEGKLFGTYAGEWACIALLINSANNVLHVGLTSRNVGDPAVTGAEDQRVGMTVFNWSKAQIVSPDGFVQHPKIFVSRDTHGYYLTSGSFGLTPFTPAGIDLSRQSCGQVEGLDGAIAQDVQVGGVPPTAGHDSNPLITAAKVVAAAAAGLAALGPFGVFPAVGAGIELAGLEGAYGTFGGAGTAAGATVRHGSSPERRRIQRTLGPTRHKRSEHSARRHEMP